MKFRRSFLSGLLLLLAAVANAAAQAAPHEEVRARVQAVLDSLHANGRFAGATAGVVLADGSSFGVAVGESDSVANAPMRPDDRMLAGSVGKTFFAAVALQLVHE